MEWTTKELTVNMEYDHGVLFAQTVSRMRYLKQAQLKEVHRIVTDMWEVKNSARQRAKWADGENPYD